MRHRVAGRRLSRDAEHRRALRRNLVQSLIEHGEIRTTLPKAKEVRSFAERLVTLAVKAAAARAGNDPATALAHLQRAEALLTDRSIIPAEQRAEYDRLSDAKRAKVLRSRSGRRYRASTTRPGVKFTAESVLHRLFNKIGPEMRKRNETRGSRGGGYTRIIKLAERRLGDGGAQAILQLIDPEDAPRKKNTDPTERRRRARVRYAVYAGKGRPQPRRRSSRAAGKPDKPEAPARSPSADSAE